MLLLYYFLTKYLKNSGELKTTNPKITKKLRKKCHRVAGHHESNNIKSLFKWNPPGLEMPYFISI